MLGYAEPIRLDNIFTDILHTVLGRNAKWIGCILRRNKLLLKHVVEGVVGRQGQEEDASSYWMTIRKGERAGT